LFSAKENGSLTSKIAIDLDKSFLTRKVSPVCGKNKFGWGVILRPTGPYRAGNDQALKILSEWPRGPASPRLRRFGSGAAKWLFEFFGQGFDPTFQGARCADG